MIQCWGYKLKFGWVERWKVCQPGGNFGIFYAGEQYGLGFIWKKYYRDKYKWTLRLFLLKWDLCISLYKEGI